MSVILFLLLTAVSAAACTVLVRIVRARSKRLLLDATHGAACGTLGDIGITAITSGVGSEAQIRNLLSVEYARYEVVVVLDARRHPGQFAAIVSNFCMIRVEHAPSGELPDRDVRSVRRSRKRCFRRLVLVDRAEDVPENDFDAAAAVASYDYLLPVREGQYLLGDTVERLVVELGEHPAGQVGLVRSWLGVPAMLLAREAVVAAGGFEGRPAQCVPREGRITLWEPLCDAPGRPRRAWRGARGAAGVLLAGGIAAAAVAGWWCTTALLLTAAVVWVAAACARQVLAERVGPPGSSLPLWRARRGKLRVKNFTIS